MYVRKEIADSELAAPAPSLTDRLVRALVSVGWFLPLLALVAGLATAKFVMLAPLYVSMAAILALVLGAFLWADLSRGILIYFYVAALYMGKSAGIRSPHSTYSEGVQISHALLGMLVLVWLVRTVLLEKSRLKRTELNVPLILLGCIAVLSTLFNHILKTRDGRIYFNELLITQVAEVALLWLSIIAFLLVVNGFNEPRRIAAIFPPVVALGLYFVPHLLIGFDFPIPVAWGHFLLAAAMAFVTARLLFSPLTRARKVILSLLLLVMTAAMYRHLAWVSGWIAATVSLLVIILYRSKWLALALGAACLFVLFVFPGLYYGLHEESLAGGDFDRFAIWQDAAQMVLSEDPLLGVGPGNYYPYIVHHSTVWFGRHTYTTAHSNYVQFVSEMGLLGLATLIWVIAAGLVATYRAARIVPPEHRWLPIAAAGTLCGLTVASVFGDYLFPSRGNNGLSNFGTTVYTWLILGAALAMAGWYRDHQPALDHDTREVGARIE